MREWPYAKEPFDTKLFVLRFIKKIHYVLIGMFAGAILIGGGYYLKKVVFGGPVEYEITTTYYIEYNHCDPVTGQMFDYTNNVTWGLWVISDKFVDKTWQYALEEGFQPQNYDMVKSDLKEYFTADLPTDLRIPTSTVTTPFEEATIALNKALQKAFLDFASERTEMDSIEITNETPLQVADKDVRVGNAIILGALLGAFIAGLCITGMIIWEESPIIPECFTYRYGIPAVGYVNKKNGECSSETLINLEHLFTNHSSNICLVLGEKEWGAKNTEKLNDKWGLELVTVAELSSEKYEQFRKAEGILLLVPAEGSKGKEIQYILHELQIQGCMCKGALLGEADDKLIQCYRFGRKEK